MPMCNSPLQDRAAASKTLIEDDPGSVVSLNFSGFWQELNSQSLARDCVPNGLAQLITGHDGDVPQFTEFNEVWVSPH